MSTLYPSQRFCPGQWRVHDRPPLAWFRTVQRSALNPALPRLRLATFCVVFQLSAVHTTSNCSGSRMRSVSPAVIFWIGRRLL